MTERGALRARILNDTPVRLDAKIDCAPGELLALLGPSGSGKSTLLRAIAGLVRPRSGRISCGEELWFDAERRVHARPRERRIGVVFQSYALFPHLSALANVMEALADRPAAERERRAAELLARVNLSGLEARKPRQLSGGQQQRVAVARALARDPDALLLDEPFAAVDRATREKLYAELAEMRKSLAMPVVLVTHDLEEAVLLADRITVLHRGQTLQTDAPLEMLARPASPTVARLLGLKNQFAATVLEHLEHATLVRWNGRVLETRPQRAFSPGSEVAWVVPGSSVLLHRPERQARGERENPVEGEIASAHALGDNVTLALRVAGEPNPLTLTVPLHVARRLGVAAGKPVRCSLLSEGIHLMAPEGAGEAAARG